MARCNLAGTLKSKGSSCGGHKTKVKITNQETRDGGRGISAVSRGRGSASPDRQRYNGTARGGIGKGEEVNGNAGADGAREKTRGNEEYV
jgi:hypothetical protein